jgi:FkbM family methyltransferase
VRDNGYAHFTFATPVLKMSSQIVRAVRSLVRRFGIDIVRYREPTFENEMRDTVLALRRLRDLAERHTGRDELAFMEFCNSNYKFSKSQIFQDLFVQYVLGEKSNGFFVEFGATNGVDLSNTYMLEKRYGWNGILAEPAKCWHNALRKNRGCTLDLRCVWDKDDEVLQFNETAAAEFSTIDSFTRSDLHAKARQEGDVYNVSTVSIDSLLRENHAPTQIDYLSADTEGSELRILSAFDFSRYRVKIVTVEHNYTADREKIHSLLSSKGFARKFEAFSLWDDWYVAQKLPGNGGGHTIE